MLIILVAPKIAIVHIQILSDQIIPKRTQLFFRNPPHDFELVLCVVEVGNRQKPIGIMEKTILLEIQLFIVVLVIVQTLIVIKSKLLVRNVGGKGKLRLGKALF